MKDTEINDGATTVQDSPSRKLDQFPVRMPDGMRDRVKIAAHVNGRSMNAEIVLALEAHLEGKGSEGGMSLRDHFAAQALAGDLASQSPQSGEFFNDTSPYHLRIRAEFYYRFADAMLAARSSTRTPD